MAQMAGLRWHDWLLSVGQNGCFYSSANIGEDAAALLDAYGVGDVPLGDLDLTPGLIERARAERGDAPLA